MPSGVYQRRPYMRCNTGEPMYKTRPDTVRYLHSMGLSYSQIGEALKVSTSTIGRHIRAAGPDGLINGVLRSHGERTTISPAHRQAISRSMRSVWAQRRKESKQHVEAVPGQVSAALVQADAQGD